MSPDNVALIKKGYADFSSGNIEGVLAVWDPAIEWHECKGMPTVTTGATLTGHKAVLDGVIATIPGKIDNFSIEIDEVFGSGDRVVMLGHYTGTFKATGKPFKAAVAHVWTFRNGRAVKMIQVADTAEIIHPKP